MIDEYSPTPATHERNHRALTINETNKSSEFTNPHTRALSILSNLFVRYKAEEVIRILGEFDGIGRPVSVKVDVLIDDPNYGSGVLEIKGSAHQTKGARKWDEKREAYLMRMGLWVESLQNSEVDREHIEAVLAAHKKAVLEFP